MDISEPSASRPGGDPSVSDRLNQCGLDPTQYSTCDEIEKEEKLNFFELTEILLDSSLICIGLIMFKTYFVDYETA